NATQLTQRQVLRDVQTLGKELERLKSNQEGFNQDIIRLTEVIAAYLATTAPAEGPGSDDDGSTTSSSSRSDTSVSPIENDPPTSGVSVGHETQSAPPSDASRASSPPSPPVPSPPPPTAVPGGTISLPSPIRPGANPPSPSKASSAPVVPSLPTSTTTPISSSAPLPPPPPSQGVSAYPTRPSPYSAPGSAPSAPRPSPSRSSSSMPSYPGSAPSAPTPPPMPIQTSMPMSPPPPPPIAEEALELDTITKVRKSVPPLTKERKDAEEIELDTGFDTKAPNWDNIEEDRKAPRRGNIEEDMKAPNCRKSKSRASSASLEDEDEEDEDDEDEYDDIHGGSGDEDEDDGDMPSPPPPPSQPILRPSTQPLPISKGPATITVPAPTQEQQAGDHRFKRISPGAETTDSPTTYTPTTGTGGRYNPPPISTTLPAPTRKQRQQQQSQQPPQPVLSKFPAGGPTIYHPDIGSSTTTSSSAVPRYKVIELQDPARERSDTAPVIGGSSGAPSGTGEPWTKPSQNHPTFRQRVQKVVAVQTVDDALKAHRRIEDNNVSHPVYVVHQPVPADARNQRQQQRYRRDSDDDGLYDDDDDEEWYPVNQDNPEDEGQHGRKNKGKKSVRSSTAPATRFVDEIQVQPYTPPQSQQTQQHQHYPHRAQMPRLPYPRRQHQQQQQP
ncbi:hypothetical protein BG015_002673, partial [Linnemannia schmuckeri]